MNILAEPQPEAEPIMFKNKPVNLLTAVTFCRIAEQRLWKLGAHCGLTGGALYREGERKDADVIIYPHDCNKHFGPDTADKILEDLKAIGVQKMFDNESSDNDKYVQVCVWQGYRPDLFFMTSI